VGAQREVEEVRIGRWPQRRTGGRARWGQQRLIAMPLMHG
jgi:hypothetical protein